MEQWSSSAECLMPHVVNLTIDWSRKRYKGEGLFVVGMMRGRRMGNIW